MADTITSNPKKPPILVANSSLKKSGISTPFSTTHGTNCDKGNKAPSTHNTRNITFIFIGCCIYYGGAARLIHEHISSIAHWVFNGRREIYASTSFDLLFSLPIVFSRVYFLEVHQPSSRVRRRVYSGPRDPLIILRQYYDVIAL